METYISDLLYRHDCVIVPSLGGFISNYKSAQIHPVSHTLRPPSKSISFNVQLQNNDGLLANYISDCESISFASAQVKIEQYVKGLQNDLEHKNQVKIAKVGILSRDTNGLLSFEPDTTVNYLLDAFGLDTVQSPAILRQSNVISLPKQVAKGAKNIKAKKSSINWRVAAVILPLIGLSTYVSFQQESVNDAYANYAYLNPFKVKPAAVYTPRAVETKETLVLTSIELSPKTETSEDLVNTTELITPAVNTIQFHLVAGCFSSESNAENLVAKLKTQGFDSSVIGQNATGLFRVAFQSFTSKDSALLKLQTLKATGTSTWLLKQ
jgi:cell division septation protein DedD